MVQENEIVIFETKDQNIILPVSNNVFSEGELNRDTNTQKMRVANVDQPVAFYTLDVIISVDYRVKSKRGVEFRQWAIPY